MKKTENLSEKEKTARLASDAFYKRSKTPKSQMIMLKILQANRLDNLRRTNKIAALAYFIQPDSKDLEIDYDLVEIIYSVSNAFIATRKAVRYFEGWTYRIYPISWGFQLTLKNYERYIVPWMETYHYYIPFCSNFKDYLHKETWVSCPYCNKVILNTNQTTKENALKLIEEKFKESLETVKETLLDEEEIKKRTAKLNSNYDSTYYFNRSRYQTYKPPYWKASYIKCPKCKQKIRISFTFFHGTDYKNYDPVNPPEFETKEIITENKEYPDPIVQAKKFQEASHFLTLKGYHQLVNSFLTWTEPYVSHIEWEILKLVDPDTLQKYLEYEFKSDEKSDEKEEQGEEEQ